MEIVSLLKPEVKALFIEAVKSELYASNLYLSIANQLQRSGLFGAQKYFLKQSADEVNDYQKLADYMNDMQDAAAVPAIPQIEDVVNDITGALAIAYETEMSMLNQYKDFYEKAEDEFDDCVTATFLIDILQCQRRSVGQFGNLIAKLNINRMYIFEFDNYLLTA